MAYSVSFIDDVVIDERLVLFRVRVQEVLVDFGGHYILIGYLFHNEYVMHKNQELILTRMYLRKFALKKVMINSNL